MTNIGCSYRFHPWSGRRLDAITDVAFAKSGLYLEGGAAPGTPPDAIKVALDPKQRLSPTQIEVEARELLARQAQRGKGDPR